MKWLCFSGWAVEPGLLKSIAPADDVIEVDYNFFKEGAFPEIEQVIPKEPYSILCYSMGTLHALEAALLFPPQEIVSIAGFASFAGFGKDAKKRRLLILQMIKGLKKSSEKTVNDFRRKAGLNNFNTSMFNTDNLIKGLELLKDCDMSQALNSELKLTLISSDNDEIVPAHISSQLLSGPGEKRLSILRGSHGAWQNNKEEIARIIQR